VNQVSIKPLLLQVLQCDFCGGDFAQEVQGLTCLNCGRHIPASGGKPLFTPPLPGLQPSAKLERGPEMGTPWRRANWHFLAQQVAMLAPEAIILDVGAGRGDFAELFRQRHYLALDVYPYPEVDVVCDLTRLNPFRPSSFDAILLMNVVEHIYDTQALFASLARTLKPDGVLVVAIPFMVKMHQVPIDYVRYTHFALKRLGEGHGLNVEHLEGFYDPLSLLGEGIGNLRWSVVPTLKGMRHYLARALTLGLRAHAAALRGVLGAGQTRPPDSVRSLAPTGYHVIYRKSRGV